MRERALCSPSVEFNARLALNIFVFSVCSDSLMFRKCLKKKKASKKKVGWCYAVFSSQIHGGRDLLDPSACLASGDRIKDPSCVNICRWLSDSTVLSASRVQSTAPVLAGDSGTDGGRDGDTDG